MKPLDNERPGYTANHATGELTIQARGLLRLCDAIGTRVLVHQGKVWITQERDLRDIVLSAGQRFELDRQGLALVHALETASVTLSAAPATVASRRQAIARELCPSD